MLCPQRLRLPTPTTPLLSTRSSLQRVPFGVVLQHCVLTRRLEGRNQRTQANLPGAGRGTASPKAAAAAAGRWYRRLSLLPLLWQVLSRKFVLCGKASIDMTCSTLHVKTDVTANLSTCKVWMGASKLHASAYVAGHIGRHAAEMCRIKSGGRR